MKEIVVTVTPDGGVEIEAAGFRGKGCLEATEWLEKLLGETKERKFKPEYHQREEQKQFLRR